jgi:anti-sigma factor (TIGR02949 family)
VSCDLTQSVLHGYMDGELDAARAADFERHLVSCSECVAALEAHETLRSSLQRVGLYERAPLALRQRVRSELHAPADLPIPVANAARPSSWRWLAIAAAFLFAAFLGWKLIPGLRGESAEAAYASAIVDAHLRSLQPGHLEDVISTDQHTVKPWFDGKLDFAPPVQDFASEGFPLQGGRLDVVHGRTVAVLVYARRKHLINVFVWPTTEPAASAQSGSQLGYHWVDWRKGGMEMCAVSDVNPTDLDALRQLLAN